MSRLVLAFLGVMLLAGHGLAEDQALPPMVVKFLSNHCVDCHGEYDGEADLNLDLTNVDWDDRESVATWEHVHQMVSKGVMPPADEEQPGERLRTNVLRWLDRSLRQSTPVGGTLIRRLSRLEFERTISRLFQLKDFSLPASFPVDNRSNGFNNQAESLVVAGAHLEAFGETATLVADRFFPEEAEAVSSTTIDVPAKDLVISYSSACLIDGAMRLGASGSVTRNATWPMRFEAPVAGDYRITIQASAQCPPGEKPELVVSTMTPARQGVTEVARFVIPADATEEFVCDVRIESGETIVFQYANSPFSYEDKTRFGEFMKDLLTNDERLAAAWHKIGAPARGGAGWLRLKETMADPDLDLSAVDDLAALIKKASQNSVNTGETLVYKYFEEGPNIGIHHVKIHGPVKQYPDRDFLLAQKQQKLLMGEHHGKLDDASLRGFFGDFLQSAFRRPVTPEEVSGYVGLVRREFERTQSYDKAMHLAIRTTLISPAFLYRSVGPGELTDYEYASRLSYFLSSAAPSEALMEVAARGDLSKSSVVQRQAQKLFTKTFAADFTQQWLGLHVLDNLMPDTRLVQRFGKTYITTMRSEVTETFFHILSNNLPVREFIAPDFLFTNKMVGWEVYGLEQFDPKNKKRIKYDKKLSRVSIPRDGRRGGLLCMPGVMMATANGVDTQPVLRGVWLLTNILGSPPPEPPKAVPALTPDTAGASSPKERLAAHMASESCAVCHREIDPLGFVLENFDPIGRWRDHYPKYQELEDGKTKMLDGAPIDATGTLPDGFELREITDLKRHLAQDPTAFARCLSEKLLCYATGRKLSYRERAMVADIVEQQKANDLRFRDLLFALIDSEIFRTK